MSPEVLTPEEAAAYLRIGKRTLYAQLNKGIIPGRKIGRVWRLSKRALEEWLEGDVEPEPPELYEYIDEVLSDSSKGSDWEQIVRIPRRNGCL